MLTHLSRIAFGCAIPSGGAVNAADWAEFEAEHIACAFPDGFTVLECHGGWKDTVTGCTIREPSIVVEVAHDGSPEAIAAIRTVATVYKTLFQQQAVMVSTVPCEVEFI